MGVQWHVVPSIIGYIMFLFIGLYFVARRPASSASRLAGAAMISASAYFAGSALIEVAVSAGVAGLISVISWPATALTPALWLHTVMVSVDWRGRTRRVVIGALYVCAAVATAAGLVDGPLFDYQAISHEVAAIPVVVVPVGPYYWVFGLYAMAAVVGAMALVFAYALKPRDSGEPGTRWPVAVGASAVLSGVAVLVAGELLGWGIPEMALQPLLFAGLGALVYSELTRSGLIEGSMIWRDLASESIGVTLLVGALALVLFLAGGDLLSFVLVVAIFTVNHAFRDKLGAIWDRVFYPEGAREERRELAAAARLSGRDHLLDIVSMDDSQLQEQVLQAIKHIYPSSRLLETDARLVWLRSIEGRLLDSDSGMESGKIMPQERANELSRLLLELIEGLRPGVAPERGPLGDEWGPYCCMRYWVIRNMRRSPSALDEKVVRWRRMRQKTYDKLRLDCERQAIASLARSIRAMESGL